MKIFRLFQIGLVVGGIALLPPSPSLARVATNRWESLDQKLRILERKLEIEREEERKKAQRNPILKAGEGGFFLQSGDGDFQLKLGGYMQTDGRFFVDNDDAGTDQFVLRRLRPVLQGTVYRHFSFKIMPEFGEGKEGEILDAYLDFHYFPELTLRAGKFKAPVGLERLQSSKYLLFVERSLTDNLVPNRDTGIQLHGKLFGSSLSYALGVFNGVQDRGSADSDANDGKTLAGRLFLEPFRNSGRGYLKGLGVGLGGSWTQKGSQTLPTYKSSGRETFFRYLTGVSGEGTHYRFSPQGYYYLGPFGVLGEYVGSFQEVRLGVTERELNNRAWQVAVSYVLTGENASYRGVKPSRPFAPGKDGWGAVELAARFSELKVDHDAFPLFASSTASARKAQDFTLGVNWHLDQNVKAVLNYEQTEFDGGGAGARDRETEKAALFRLQLAF